MEETSLFRRKAAEPRTGPRNTLASPRVGVRLLEKLVEKRFIQREFQYKEAAVYST
jgi:hypothetical protein